MATLTVEDVTNTGLNATYNAVSASDEFANNGRVIIHVVNADASANTVGITTPQTVNGLAVADAGGSVPAGEDRFFGPFPLATFNDGSGNVTVTHSNTTSNTVAVLRIS